MYSIKELIRWINDQIKKEQRNAYISICIILIGMAVGMRISCCLFKEVQIIDVITKTSTLGISFTTLVGIFYYLYKSDEIQTRISSFLDHMLNQMKAENPTMSTAEMQKIIMDILKERINEKTDLIAGKEDGKKHD